METALAFCFLVIILLILWVWSLHDRVRKHEEITAALIETVRAMYEVVKESKESEL